MYVNKISTWSQIFNFYTIVTKLVPGVLLMSNDMQFKNLFSKILTTIVRFDITNNIVSYKIR